MIKLKKLISDIADYRLRELTHKKKGKISSLMMDNDYIAINGVILLQTNIPSSVFQPVECTASLHSMYRTMAEKDYKKCAAIFDLNNQALFKIVKLYNEDDHIATFNADYLKYFEKPSKLEYYAINRKSPIMIKDEFNNKAFIMPIA